MNSPKLTNKIIHTALSSLALIAISGIGASAQSVLQEEQSSPYRLNERTNLAYSSFNPARLIYHDGQSFQMASLVYDGSNGGFKNVDAPLQSHHFSAAVSGYRNLGKTRLSGHLKYTNARDLDMPWNSTLWLDRDNPFIIADSLNSDKTVESFDLGATASINLGDCFKTGIHGGLAIGISSDQEDPRPKISTSRIPLSAGIIWTPNDEIGVGISAGVDIYRSFTQYSIENNLIAHRYFLMKGMADYHGLSSSQYSGYNRHYIGNTGELALQFYVKPDGGKPSNFLEIYGKKGSQIAEDGGSSYLFKGGDYLTTEIGLSDRLYMESSSKGSHQLRLEAGYKSGDGYWYDQKARTDTAHANLTYYEILAKTLIHHNSSLSGELAYYHDFALMKGMSYIEAGTGFAANSIEHYNADGSSSMSWNLASARLATGWENKFSDGSILHISLQGTYTMPIGERLFGSGGSNIALGDITQDWLAPKFEYESCSKFRAGTTVDYSFILKGVRAGIRGSFDCLKYCSGGEFHKDFITASTRSFYNLTLYTVF